MSDTKMMQIIISVTVLFLSSPGLSAGMMANDECEVVQYLSIGEDGIIQCSFETFLAISWYSSEENRDILFYKDGVKSGDGFDSGDYDIYPNGSLLVRNVTVDHEALFTVTKVISAVDVVTIQYDIQIKTVVKPTTPYPIIDECAEETRSCLLSVNSDGYIRCYTDKSRPQVNLTWIEKKYGSDIILPSSYFAYSHDNITFMSQAIASYSVSQLSLLSIFICQVSGVPNDLVNEKEFVVLLEKLIDYAKAVTPNEVHVEANFDMMLPCSDKTIGSIVWKQLLNGKDSWRSILYTIPPAHHFTQYYVTEFDVNSKGNLLLSSIKTEHEGLYACVHQDDRKEDITLYDVKVYVNPVPAYPVVDGCNHQQYCVLHVTDGDFLNCSVFGIRPAVELEWKALQDTDKVSFEDRSHSVKQSEDLFNVILTSKVAGLTSSGNRVTVECRVTESDNRMFELSTTLDLVFQNTQVTNKSGLSFQVIAIVAVALVVLVVVVFVLIITLCFRRRATQRNEPAHIEEQEEERVPMIPGVNENSPTTRVSEKEKVFITQLKTKYTIMYDSVQPIPYIRDRMYCVDKVYVEGGIECLTDVARRIWSKLTSYHSLLNETNLNSKRQIIEGEPGYGKSTLILQLVYDWCNSIPSSPLGAVDIIIYLRLRQLSGVNSIATAIKRFILPKDTSLSEEDIKEILHKSSKILLLLDGFDEYPDQDNQESFVHDILKRESFQDADVILTTRSSCFPMKIIPQTNRLRLTGFNEEARDKYIRKAVAGEDHDVAKRIKRKLLENPVLGDLCEVPLFFVMFAHMTYENKRLADFTSVTSFFSYMIQCFHSHMKNKMEEENVARFDFENNHKKLDKVAFDALNRKNQKIVWGREELTEALGADFYNKYVQIGILVEDEVLEKTDESKPVINLRYQWEVRFYHKLFCEWYAAHHLSDYICNTNYDKYDEFFKYFDPYDLQYLYRFTCGIDAKSSRKIIKHFQSSNENQKFAVLCMLEQSSNNEGVLEEIRNMVSATAMSINVEDTKLLQRSTIQILDIASRNKIKICSLVLENSFLEKEGSVVILKSGIVLPSLQTLKNIEIHSNKGLEITQDNVLELITYGSTCTNLRTMKFSNCILPLSYPAHKLASSLKSKSFDVLWTEDSVRLQLNPDTGQWKQAGTPSFELVVDQHDTLRKRCGKQVIISKHDTSQIQRSISCLLEIASSHEIRTPTLVLDECFDTFKGRNITLSSGTSLPPLACVGKLLIKTNDKEVTSEAVAGISDYGRLCSGLTELRFHKSCNLPTLVDEAVIGSDVRSWTIPVSWCPFDRDFQLDLQSGQWKVDDLNYISHRCSDGISINSSETMLQQRSTIQLLVIASNHNIPISLLTLLGCSPRIDESGVKLVVYPGLTLPTLKSLQKLWIKGKIRISNVELEAILRYIPQFESLKELRLDSTVLPKTVSLKAIPASLISSNIKVLQYNKGKFEILNFETGEWQIAT